MDSKYAESRTGRASRLTLVELAIAIAVVGVVTAMALQSRAQAGEGDRIALGAEGLASDLTFTRNAPKA